MSNTQNHPAPSISHPKISKRRRALRIFGPVIFGVTLATTVAAGLHFDQLLAAFITVAVEVMVALATLQTDLLISYYQRGDRMLREHFESSQEKLLQRYNEGQSEIKTLTEASQTTMTFLRIKNPEASSSINGLLSAMADFPEHSVLYKEAARELEETAESIRKMAAGKEFNKFLVPTGADFTKSITTYMGDLKEGDTWQTVSNLDLWSHDTLSTPMDFMDANVEAARRGVEIQRVIVLDRQLNAEQIRMLQMHQRYSRLHNNLQTKIYRPDDYERAFMDLGNFAVWKYERTRELTRELLTLQVIYRFAADEKSVERLVVSKDDGTILKLTRRFTRAWDEYETQDIVDIPLEELG